jgi:hypothetical protein
VIDDDSTKRLGEDFERYRIIQSACRLKIDQRKPSRQRGFAAEGRRDTRKSHRGDAIAEPVVGSCRRRAKRLGVRKRKSSTRIPVLFFGSTLYEDQRSDPRSQRPRDFMRAPFAARCLRIRR